MKTTRVWDRTWLAGATLALALAVSGCLLATEEATKMLGMGDRAPEFSGTDQNGKTVSLSAYQDKQAVVLYFYPKDFTPGCTKEACSFRDAYEVFADAGAAVIGVSGDTAESHQKFTTEHKLPFSLISDSKGKIRSAFGVPRTAGLIPGRVTFVIDKKGIIRFRFSSQTDIQKHVGDALAEVKKLSGVTPPKPVE